MDEQQNESGFLWKLVSSPLTWIVATVGAIATFVFSQPSKNQGTGDKVSKENNVADTNNIADTKKSEGIVNLNFSSSGIAKGNLKGEYVPHQLPLGKLLVPGKEITLNFRDPDNLETTDYWRGHVDTSANWFIVTEKKIINSEGKVTYEEKAKSPDQAARYAIKNGSIDKHKWNEGVIVNFKENHELPEVQITRLYYDRQIKSEEPSQLKPPVANHRLMDPSEPLPKNSIVVIDYSGLDEALIHVPNTVDVVGSLSADKKTFTVTKIKIWEEPNGWSSPNESSRFKNYDITPIPLPVALDGEGGYHIVDIEKAKAILKAAVKTKDKTIDLGMSSPQQQNRNIAPEIIVAAEKYHSEKSPLAERDLKATLPTMLTSNINLIG